MLHNIFQTKRRNKERHYKLIKGKSTKRTLKSLKSMHQIQVHKRNTPATKITFWPQTMIVDDFNTYCSQQTGHPDKKQRNAEANWHYKPNGPNRYFQNISPKHKKIHLLSISWNFLKNWTHTGYKTSFNRYKKTEITANILSDHHELKIDNNDRNIKKFTNS